MKEINLKIGGVWNCVTAIIITAMLCGTAVYMSIQYSQTQKDITNTQAQTMKDSASKIEQGLKGVGKGICQTSERQWTVCAY